MILVSIIVFIIIVFISIIISANTTGVLNPISSVYNMTKILCVEDELYVVAQSKPWKIMFSKPSADGKPAIELLDDFMKSDGYELTDRMGSILTYTNEKGYERRIHFSVNKYYSIWEWI